MSEYPKVYRLPIGWFWVETAAHSPEGPFGTEAEARDDMVNTIRVTCDRCKRSHLAKHICLCRG